jgi:hypothetical protein
MYKMRGALGRSIMVAALGLAASLTGCSAGPLTDHLPAELSMPADVPPAPAAPYQYPAVHDMPPPRPTKPMTAEEQLQMEKQLSTLRDRQEHLLPADKKPKKAAKKKPAKPQNIESAGAKTNP